jgi:hypothetical protein
MRLVNTIQWYNVPILFKENLEDNCPSKLT